MKEAKLKTISIYGQNYFIGKTPRGLHPPLSRLELLRNLHLLLRVSRVRLALHASQFIQFCIFPIRSIVTHWGNPRSYTVKIVKWYGSELKLPPISNSLAGVVRAEFS